MVTTFWYFYEIVFTICLFEIYLGQRKQNVPARIHKEIKSSECHFIGRPIFCVVCASRTGYQQREARVRRPGGAHPGGQQAVFQSLPQPRSLNTVRVRVGGVRVSWRLSVIVIYNVCCASCALI